MPLFVESNRLNPTYSLRPSGAVLDKPSWYLLWKVCHWGKDNSKIFLHPGFLYPSSTLYFRGCIGDLLVTHTNVTSIISHCIVVWILQLQVWSPPFSKARTPGGREMMVQAISKLCCTYSPFVLGFAENQWHHLRSIASFALPWRCWTAG